MEEKSQQAYSLPAPGPQHGFAKGSFGYKMSKKVAELTQVVHMLFTRNHEREVELDELRDAYEQEISNVIQDARSRIEKLEFQLRESERRRKRQSDQTAGNTAQLLREAQDRMEVMKNELHDEKKESTQLRDLLTQAHKDLERLKQGSSGVSEDLIRKGRILEERERELQKLWQNHTDQEAKLRANNKYTDEIKKQLEISQEDCHKIKLQSDRIIKVVEEKNRKCEELQRKIRHMEEETKYFRRELNKKIKETNKDKSHERRPNTSAKDNEKASVGSQSKLWKEEVDRLRREIEWLRNELKNREGNFNRVFASFQPVFVGSSQSKTHQEFLQDRDMMMVTPTSSFTPIINSNRNSLVASPNPIIGGTSRRRPPNLTGLEPRIQSMVPTPTPFRPPTRSGSSLRLKDINASNGQTNSNNFRLIYTK